MDRLQYWLQIESILRVQVRTDRGTDLMTELMTADTKGNGSVTR